MLRVEIVILAVSVLMAVASCNFAEDYYRFRGTKTTIEQIDLEGIESIEVRLHSSDIRVIHEEKPQAVFEIKRNCKAKDIKSGEELLAKVKLTFEKVNGVLKVEEVWQGERRIADFGKGWVSLEITLTIPRGLELALRLGSGDVEIDGFSGRLEVVSGSGDLSIGRMDGDGDFSTGSGDIDLKLIEGDVKCRTGSGDVNFENIHGNVSIATGSGDISIREVTGDLSARTVSGSVWIRSKEGMIKVRTSSGDVFVESDADRGEIDINASSGSVLVVLTHVESVDLDLRAVSGSISSQIPIEVRSESTNRLVGSSGDRELRVRVKSLSGNITLRQGSV